jgi:hypothetical protein
MSTGVAPGTIADGAAGGDSDGADAAGAGDGAGAGDDGAGDGAGACANAPAVDSRSGTASDAKRAARVVGKDGSRFIGSRKE